MCGLVGVVTKLHNGFSKKQQDIFGELLYVDMLRGNDSTGVFSVSNNGNMHMMKEASTPVEFMKHKEYDAMMTRAWSTGRALIGHNRKATRGTITDDNAHPFVVDDNIVLVHNGTMYGDHKKIADVEVDSHAIAHLIHNHKGNVEEALSELSAAYALIWYNVEEESLNFIRNTQRPLYWVELDDCYLWASEQCMLEFVMSRNSVKAKNGPALLPEHTLFSYNFEKGGWKTSTKKLDLKAYSFSYEASSSYTYNNIEIEEAESEWKKYWAAGGSMSKDGNGWVNTYPKNNESDGKTPYEMEREVAVNNNKLITHAQYSVAVVPEYPHGCKVVAAAFDYTYANGKNSSAGFYLFSAVVGQSDVIVRHYLSNTAANDERLLQWCGGEYVFEFTINQRSWRPVASDLPAMEIRADTSGFAVLYTNGVCKIISGGGITTPGYEEKVNVERLH